MPVPDFAMPRLSDTMEDGTIVAWLKEDGDEVEPGDDLVEIETDKATMSCQAETGGTLRIVVPEGGVATVGETIATIGDAASSGGAAPAGDDASAPAAADDADESSVAAGTASGERAPAAAPAGSRDTAARDAAATTTADGAVKASPVARRMARRHGVDLGAVAGSGPRGRILKADIEAFTDAPPASSPAAPPARGEGRGTTERRDLTRIERIVAERMVQAKTEAPEFFLTVDVDMTEAVHVRAQLKDALDDGEPVPSYNDFVVRAAALALARHPHANGAFVDDAFERYSRVNVGVAVAAAESLLVPTVFDADRKTLGAIAADTRRLAGEARDGAIAPQDLSSGTFTVSNLGMFGIREFTAVLNAPQAAILAVGQMTTRPVWRDDAFVPRSLMTMTLTCDHRILYGADAAAFLAEIRGLLERPLLLAL